MTTTSRRTAALRIVRVVTGMGVAALLALQYGHVSGFGSAAIYAATWVTFLHICVGEYVFIRGLNAQSHIQNALDALGAVFLLAGVISFTSPALWCAFFGGLFALAVTKYLLVAREADDPGIRRYAREKAHWETPVVVGLAVLAVVLDKLPPTSTAARLLQFGILAATTGFAVWMIAVRHAYRRVMDRSNSKPVTHPSV